MADSIDPMRQQAIDIARELRIKFYRSLGELKEEALTTRFSNEFSRDLSWPADQEQYRVIYTDKSTVVITDGLSDPFAQESEDPKLQRNGHGFEAFVEFSDKVKYELLTKSPMLSVLVGVVETLIAQGNAKKLLIENKYISMERNDDRLPAKYQKEGRFGVMLGVKSANVPATMKLNLEDDVLLIGVKLLTYDELEKAAVDDDVVRVKLEESFTDCYSPTFLY